MDTLSLPDAKALLAELEEGRALTEINSAVESGRRQITKIRYTHDAMIDILVAEPYISQGDLARRFGYTEPWVSTVMQTDLFQARMAERREEIVDPILRATVKERFAAMVTKSLEVLQQKLSKADINQIPDNLALRALELGAKAMGLGGNVAPAPPPVSPDHLNQLAERLVLLQANVRRERGTYNAEDARLVER